MESIHSSIAFQKIFYLFEVCHMIGGLKGDDIARARRVKK